MKAKMDELLKGNNIERVEGPTTSASPVVVALKLSGEIRLCVDMRRASRPLSDNGWQYPLSMKY